MATKLEPADLRALDQLRQRLSQLTNSITTLQRDLAASETLPPWPQLTSLLSIIAQNLSNVSAHQTQHRALLARLAVFPLPSFPGRAEEGLLGQLIRKKLEPAVDDWVESGLAAGLALEPEQQEQQGKEKPERSLDAKEFRELWEWAGGAANEAAREHPWGGDYTLAEVARGVAGVATGLRRKLRVPGEEEDDDDDDDDDDNDDEGDEDMEDVGAEKVTVRRGSMGRGGVELDITREKRVEGKEGKRPMPLDEQFRFLMTGQLPKGFAF